MLNVSEYSTVNIINNDNLVSKLFKFSLETKKNYFAYKILEESPCKRFRLVEILCKTSEIPDTCEYMPMITDEFKDYRYRLFIGAVTKNHILILNSKMPGIKQIMLVREDEASSDVHQK